MYKRYFEDESTLPQVSKRIIRVKRKLMGDRSGGGHRIVKKPFWDVFAIYKSPEYPQEDFVIKIGNCKTDTRQIDDGRSRIANQGSERVFYTTFDTDGVKSIIPSYEPSYADKTSKLEDKRYVKDVCLERMVMQLNDYCNSHNINDLEFVK